MKKTGIKQWVILTVLIVWAMASFIALIAEAAPDCNVSFRDMLTLKGLAVLSFALCVLAGKWLDKKGLLPETNENYYE